MVALSPFYGEAGAPWDGRGTLPQDYGMDPITIGAIMLAALPALLPNLLAFLHAASIKYRMSFEKLVNRTSMTWRNLPAARKQPGSDAEWTLLIKEYPALVRRPVTVTDDGVVSVGFTDKQYKLRFGV